MAKKFNSLIIGLILSTLIPLSSALAFVPSSQIDDYIKIIGKIILKQSGKAAKEEEIYMMISKRFDDLIPIIKELPDNDRIKFLLEAAEGNNVIKATDKIRINREIAQGKYSEDDLIRMIKTNEKQKKGPSKTETDESVPKPKNPAIASSEKYIAREDNVDRWNVDKPKFRKGRMQGDQDNAKYAAMDKNEAAKIKKNWEKANGRACNGAVHHIIPKDMIKQKNRDVETVFDNCGEFYYPDSPDYIHNARNAICITNGHANHPNYNKSIENLLASIPQTLDRENSCKAIGDVRNCLRKQLELTEMGGKVDNIPIDFISIASSSVICSLK